MLGSPFEPSLKADEADLSTNGHQNFHGQRSGMTMEKERPWDDRSLTSGPINTKGGKTKAFSSGGMFCAKTLVPAA